MVRADCRLRWKPMLLLALLIAGATATCLIPLELARRTSTAFDRRLSSARAADVLLNGPDRPSQQDLATTPVPSLATLPGVAEEDRYIGVFLFFPDVASLTIDHVLRSDPADGDISPANLAVLDAPGPKSEIPVIERGRLPDWTRDDELVISSRVAEATGWKVGSRVKAQVLDNSISAIDPNAPDALDKVKAVLKTRLMTVVGIGTLAGAPREGSQELIMTTPAFVAATNPIVQYSVHGVHVDRKVTPGDIIDEAQANGIAGLSVFEDRSQMSTDYDDAMRPDVVSMTVFAVVTAIVAMLVLGQALAREAMARGDDAPTHMAMGMTFGQRLAIPLVRVASMALLGVAVGAGVSVVVTPR